MTTLVADALDPLITDKACEVLKSAPVLYTGRSQNHHAIQVGKDLMKSNIQFKAGRSELQLVKFWKPAGTWIIQPCSVGSGRESGGRMSVFYVVKGVV